MSQPKVSGRGRASIVVAVLTILAIGMLFAAPAYAAVDFTVADNECTVTVTFDDEGDGQATVTATAIPPTDEGVVFSDTFFLDDDGDGEITFDLQFTGEPANNGWHVRLDATSPASGDTHLGNFFAEDCPDPVPPTSPPVPPPPTVIVPTGGVDTGTAATTAGPGLVLPVVGLGLLVGSALWMRRRSIG